MLLFAILALAIVLMLSFGIIVLGAGGAIGVIVFSDIIVCVAIIMALFKRKKKK